MNYFTSLWSGLWVGLVLISSTALGQSVGVGTTSPRPSAALQIVAPNNDQGILIPTLTTEQRNSPEFTANLSSEDNGLMVFDLTENRFYFWTDDRWTNLVSGPISSVLQLGPGIELNDQNQLINVGDADSTDDVTNQTEAGGDLIGLYPSPEIAAGVVDTENLADSAVVGGKIADGTVPVNKLTGLGDTALGRNSLLITNNTNTPRWFQPSLNQVIVTDNAGQITSRPVGSFTQTKLPEGNIFIGNTNEDAEVLDASNNGRILVGNGTSLVSVEVMGDLSLDGTGNAQITSEAVGTNEIQDGTIIEVDMADGAVSGNKILDGSVTASDLAPDAVGSATIVDLSILNDDISTTAGIEVGKLEAMATGTIVFGNDGVPTIGPLGGDATIDESGLLSLGTLDNVTISGGSIDNTPVGETTASTGSFTTLTAADGSGVENLNADNLSAGTLSDDRLPDLITAGSYGGGGSFVESVTVDDKGRVTGVVANVPPSDRRLKENIQPLNASHRKLSGLQAYQYTWRDPQYGQQPQIGLIAQEVEEIFPELVQVRSDGYKGVQYQGFIPILIEAVKAQQTAAEQQEMENKQLRDRIRELERQSQEQSQQIQLLQQQVNRILKLETQLPAIIETEQ